MYIPIIVFLTERSLHTIQWLAKFLNMSADRLFVGALVL